MVLDIRILQKAKSMLSIHPTSSHDNLKEFMQRKRVKYKEMQQRLKKEKMDEERMRKIRKKYRKYDVESANMMS